MLTERKEFPLASNMMLKINQIFTNLPKLLKNSKPVNKRMMRSLKMQLVHIRAWLAAIVTGHEMPHDEKRWALFFKKYQGQIPLLSFYLKCYFSTLISVIRNLISASYCKRIYYTVINRTQYIARGNRHF